MMRNKLIALPLALLLGFSVHTNAQPSKEKVLNLYSARHYQTDEALYANFTKSTGIKINRIEADDNALIERLNSEGSKSPADVILLVDAARLWRAQVNGFFKPIQSKYLNERIPVNLRAKADTDGTTWFGFSTRARIVVYNKNTVKPGDVNTYEKLAEPMNKGKVCTRSGSHPYMLSLLGALIERNGEKATEAWASGMVANMARSPKGGDTDQIKGVASGECAVAVTNTYYLARLMRSTNAAEKALIDKVGVVFPNQSSWGTHLNIAGGAIAKNSKNQGNALKFLEYLASASAQNHFANGNNEWPAARGLSFDNPALKAMSGGGFKSEVLPVSAVGLNQIKVQQMLDRVGFR